MKLTDAAALWHLAQRFVQAPRASREDRLAAVFAVLLWCLLMLCVVAPSYRSLEARRVEHREAQAMLARVRALSRAGAPLPAPVTAPGTTALIAVVNRTAPGFGLAFGDFRPEGDTRLALGLRDGDFDALLRWLVLLDSQHDMAVAVMDVRPTDRPGRVDAGLTLMRKQPARRGGLRPER